MSRPAGSEPLEYVRVGFTKSQRETVEKARLKVWNRQCDWMCNNYAAANEREFINHLVYFVSKRILEVNSHDEWVNKRTHKLGRLYWQLSLLAGDLHTGTKEMASFKIRKRKSA